MAQYFDDVKVSDKGMIKLIRNNGKDYMFPASKVVRVSAVHHYEKLDDTVVFWLRTIMTIKNAYLARNGEMPQGFPIGQKTKPDTICLEMEGETLYVDVLYSDELHRRLDEARAYSINRERDKYGVFR